MTIKTIFLDRDGVINKEVNYLHNIDDFEFIDGVFEACRHFQKLGYEIIIITNQSGIARGYYTENDYQLITKWMLDQFEERNVKILDVFHCPHGPDSSCDCRKPKPGMLLQAINQYGIDMKKSWMIGDKDVDIKAANAANIQNTIMVKSGHPIDLKNSKTEYVLDYIKQFKAVIRN